MKNSRSHPCGNSQGNEVDTIDDWLWELPKERYRVNSGHIHKTHGFNK